MSGVLYRMITDGSAAGTGIANIFGVKLSVARNTFADMPFEAVSTLQGWTNCGKVGPTANRPIGASSGEHYIDTTLNKLIIADALGYWHDPLTGAIV